MEEFNQLAQIIEKARPDAQAFYEKNNQAAGTRLRVAMQEAKEAAQNVRMNVSEVKNSKS